MFTKNIGKSERVLRLLIGLILLLIGYQVSGVSRFLAYFIGILMILTSFLGWCWLYGLLGFSSRGKGMNAISKSEIERVVRENRITPLKISVEKVEGVDKKVVRAAPKKKTTIKKVMRNQKISGQSKTSLVSVNKSVSKAVPKKVITKKVVAKKTTTKKAAPKKKSASKTK